MDCDAHHAAIWFELFANFCFGFNSYGFVYNKNKINIKELNINKCMFINYY